LEARFLFTTLTSLFHQKCNLLKASGDNHHVRLPYSKPQQWPKVRSDCLAAAPASSLDEPAREFGKNDQKSD